MFVIDNTDPAKPVTVGEWHLPIDTGVWTIQYQASPHYITLWGRTLFVSMYHAGLWAVDLSTPAALASPPSIGVYLPAIAGVSPSGTSSNAAPFSLQVDAFPDGTLVLTESRSGVYLLAFDPANPAPPAKPHAYG